MKAESRPRSDAPVLVTGGSGFVAGHAIVELLQLGRRVRTTLRNTAKQGELRRRIARHVNPGNSLEVVQADLNTDDGWQDAVDGCEVVHHVASPLTATRNEAEVIEPAVGGVLRVLRAAREAGVRRVVYTSSCAAVYYGHPGHVGPFTEEDWTDVDGEPMSAYVKSKALAERAAWDFVGSTPALEFTTVNPTGIFGPPLDGQPVSSLGLIQSLLDGNPPLVPNLWFGIVDVRDVVDLHLRAAASADAVGQRFIATGSAPISMVDIARLLHTKLKGAGRKVPTRRAPDPVVRFVGRFNTQIHDLVPLLGQKREASSEKARRVLQWDPRRWQDTMFDTAAALSYR